MYSNNSSLQITDGVVSQNPSLYGAIDRIYLKQLAGEDFQQLTSCGKIVNCTAYNNRRLYVFEYCKWKTLSQRFPSE